MPYVDADVVAEIEGVLCDSLFDILLWVFYIDICASWFVLGTAHKCSSFFDGSYNDDYAKVWVYGNVDSEVDDALSCNKKEEEDDDEDAIAAVGWGRGRGQSRGYSSGGHEDICNESVVSELLHFY